MARRGHAHPRSGVTVAVAQSRAALCLPHLSPPSLLSLLPPSLLSPLSLCPSSFCSLSPSVFSLSSPSVSVPLSLSLPSLSVPPPSSLSLLRPSLSSVCLALFYVALESEERALAVSGQRGRGHGSTSGRIRPSASSWPSSVKGRMSGLDGAGGGPDRLPFPRTTGSPGVTPEPQGLGTAGRGPQSPLKGYYGTAESEPRFSPLLERPPPPGVPRSLPCPVLGLGWGHTARCGLLSPALTAVPLIY